MNNNTQNKGFKLVLKKRQVESIAVRLFLELTNLNIPTIEHLTQEEILRAYPETQKGNLAQFRVPALIIESEDIKVIGGHSILRYLANWVLEDDALLENGLYPKDDLKRR